MAGVVVRADILEDKDGKSRGMGTVTFDLPIEAVQAVCILKQYANSYSRSRVQQWLRLSDILV